VSVPEQQLLLAIESSCDETAAAVIAANRQVLSSVIATQDNLHARFGGVVPEIAARAHLERILPVIDEALRRADISLSNLKAVAVVTHPGLAGSLLVGLTAAKALSLALDLPLIPVNHIEAHLYACRMTAGRDVFPGIGLVVSGGHTNLYFCRTPTNYELIGSTIDDAAGEAFDKVARILGLGYPGGPAISAVAENGDPTVFNFPRAFLHDQRLAFSFSGLKTAVLYEVHGNPGSSKPVPAMSPQRTADMAASFEQAVVDILIAKSRQALRQYSLNRLCIGGGVAANQRFRSALADLQKQDGIEVVIAASEYCTDNAAMCGLAWELFEQGQSADYGLDVTAGLVRHQTEPSRKKP